MRINGGFFVFRPEIFDYIEPGEELVLEPFQRLIEARRADRLPLRRLLGPWTRSRRSSCSRTSTTRAGALGGLEAPAASDAGTDACRWSCAAAGRRHRSSCSCLGAHCDDIEIGAAAPSSSCSRERRARRPLGRLELDDERAREARAAAAAFLGGPARRHHRASSATASSRTRAPRQGLFEALKRDVQPDLSSPTTGTTGTRTTASCRELTWNTLRDHLILEYEIPKYDGDFGRRTLRPPRPAGAERKTARCGRLPHPGGAAGSTADCSGRCPGIRGMEGAAPDRLAEASTAEAGGLTQRPLPAARAGAGSGTSTAGSTRSSQHSRQ